MKTRRRAVWRRGLLLGGLMLSAGAAGAQVPAAGHGPYFPADAPWYQDVSTAPVDAESSTVKNWLNGGGGWGGGRMQIDVSTEGPAAEATPPHHSSPLLFSADEVAAGHIDHAIRFILPNSRMRRNIYVHPATHSTGSTSGPASAPPYGTRLRLRANYPIQNLPAGAQVVARAMQKYGILLADGGTIALTAQSDQFTTAKWSGLLDPLDLSALQVTDFVTE